jgi:hypothetical protein
VKEFSMSPTEREHLFLTELIKVGIDFQQARKAAKVLALQLSDEQLTQEEDQLVQEVCRQWLIQRKRMAFISQVLEDALKTKTAPRGGKAFRR